MTVILGFLIILLGIAIVVSPIVYSSSVFNIILGRILGSVIIISGLYIVSTSYTMKAVLRAISPSKRNKKLTQDPYYNE